MKRLLAVVLLLAACASPAAQSVVQTQIVERTVAVNVEVPVTIEVEVTRQVEVTREIVVTSPPPTALGLDRDYIQIGQSIIRHNSIGDAIINGEITNTGPYPLQFVKISARLYDAAGTLVGTGDTYMDSDVIRNGEVSTFTLYVSDADNIGVTYELAISDAERA